LKEHLKISIEKIRQMERAGMPHIKIGSRPRYDLLEVLKWLRDQDKEGLPE